MLPVTCRSTAGAVWVRPEFRKGDGDLEEPSELREESYAPSTPYHAPLPPLSVC